MEQINEVINPLRNITEQQLIDLGVAIAVIIFFFIFSSIFSYLIIKMFMIKEKDKLAIKNNPLFKPLKALFIVCGIYLGILIINPAESIMKLCKQILDIVFICIVAKGLVNFVDPKKGIVRKMQNDDMPDGNKTVARFTSKILKYIIYIGAGLLILAVFGINPSSLITGLGIMSAVVALAAQDFVKNLISGFSIMADKPFLVGDWITVGTNEGTVVDISFRCTKIKTADNSVVTMQNSIFSTNNIVNWSRMKQRRYLLNIKLPLETNSDKVEKIIGKIKFILNNNEDIDKETIQVHFDAIGLDSINIIVYMYTDIIDYAAYLAFREDVNEDILKILESENTKLAYPGQNVYVHQVEDEKVTVAEEK